MYICEKETTTYEQEIDFLLEVERDKACHLDLTTREKVDCRNTNDNRKNSVLVREKQGERFDSIARQIIRRKLDKAPPILIQVFL